MGEGGCLDPVFALMATVAAAACLGADPVRDEEGLTGVVTEAAGILWDCDGDG